MFKRFVLDTCSIISYFSDYFLDASQKELSESTSNLIRDAINEVNETILIIPNVVFIEIYEKWYVNEEEKEKIRYNVYEPLKSSNNIEFKSISKDVLLNLADLLNNHTKPNFDNHDKQVLASAIELNSQLVTSDEKIKAYVKKTKCIPGIIY